MKFIYLFLFVFLNISNSVSQTNVGISRDIRNIWVGNHKAETFEYIKKTQTVFVLPDSNNKDELKSIIESIWTINEITFINQHEFDSEQKKYLSKGNMYIQLLDLEIKEERRSGVTNIFKKTFFSADIFKNAKENKKGELVYDRINIAEIYLAKGIIHSSLTKESGYDLKLGVIKNYFQELNRRLDNDENLKMLDGIVNKEKLALLSEEVLIVPWEGVPNSPLLSKNNNLIKSWNKPPNLFKKYAYKHQVINHMVLEEKILNEEDFYYLQYTQYNALNILSIIHSVSGEIVYLDVKKLTHFVKAPRITSISNIISKNQ